MKAGFGRIEINPPVGIPIGGNCRTDFLSRGVHDCLYADILVMSGPEDYMVFTDIDWCEAPLEIICKFKQTISENTGFDYSRICVTMTHTHSGPDTFGYLNPRGILPSTLNYINETAKKISQVINDLKQNMIDVLIGIGKGSCDKISFNRRVFFKDGTLHMNWEAPEISNLNTEILDKPEGPIDPDLYAIKICDTDSKLKAVVVNFALHPAILVGLDRLFSKDYIWGLEEYIKKIYGEDVFIYFANGAEGNINHIDMWNSRQSRGWDEALRIGNELGECVKELLDKTGVNNENNLKAVYRNIRLPIRAISKEELEWARKTWNDCKGIVPELMDGIPPEWYAGNLIKLAEESDKCRELELHAVKIGDFVIATLPGEFFIEFGLMIKEKSKFKNTLIFGLANQSVGYVPTIASFKNGGYETMTCESSILMPDAGYKVVEEILDMLAYE